MTAEALVVERELTADEKRDRDKKGLVAADVQDVHVPNAMRNLACTGACTQSQP